MNNNLTLKKQVGCFNHRVVTLVAILSGLHKVSFGIWDKLHKANREAAALIILQPLAYQ